MHHKFPVIVIALLGLLVLPQTAGAQLDAPYEDASEQSNAELLSDFAHYARIDRLDLARAWAEAIVGREIEPKDFVELVDRMGYDRFKSAVDKASRRIDVEPVVARLLTLYDRGKLDLARDADNIAQNIEDLTGTQLQRMYARTRLKTAGEYAMPQLLSALLQRRDDNLRVSVRSLLIEMSRQSVIPLATALPGLDPTNQEDVVEILGLTEYPAARPFLYDMHANAENERLRRKCEEAIRKLDGAFDPDYQVADWYRALAENYIAESRSLTSFPGEEMQLLWEYNPGIGLVMQAIDTRVFHEAMAMRLCERALRLSPDDERAMALWVSANFSREIDTPAEYDNPAYPPTRRSAMYYAVASGPTVAQRVLGRALDARDTQVARLAIEALTRTAGSRGLWDTEVEGRTPLLEALRYPNRRVQHEAALAIGTAQPMEFFEGAERVVPILAGSVLDAGRSYAVVIADAERQNGYADALRRQGYVVLPPATSLRAIEQEIADAPGVDLVVANLASLPAASTEELIAQMETNSKLRATPVLVLQRYDVKLDQGPRYISNPRIRVGRQGMSISEVVTSSEQLREIASGAPLTAEEAEQYKTRSLRVLRDLAVSRNPVLDLSTATTTLLTALGESEGSIRTGVAQVVSYIDRDDAQVALFDNAVSGFESGLVSDEDIELLRYTAESAKRFGSMLDPRQVKTVRSLARASEPALATQAAALMGALDLPTSEVVPLILEQDSPTATASN